MIGIPLGLFAANAAEWVIHKHILHGLGRKKNTFWSFHWHDHHRLVRKLEHFDPHYERSLLQWNGQSKEALGLLLLSLAHLPAWPLAPFYTTTVWYSALNYYRKHKRSHLDPTWGRAHLPWHYDHHMGPKQDANWCVTRPWFDHIMGTRKPYVGTEREEKDRARKAEKSDTRPIKKAS